MDKKQLTTMKNMILGMFESKPGLREGDCLPPRWLLQTEIINLDEKEKYALESAFNELHDSKLINISKTEDDQNQIISITQIGVDYIIKNKIGKKHIIKRKNVSKLSISSMLEDILPDNENKV
ncbi:MAG: hypothetical protein L3J59_12180 [Methylococcaceae bacterium]|nr:hypothetical protein [Methylococcaceae bacterium]